MKEGGRTVKTSPIITNQPLNLRHQTKQITVIFHHMSLAANNLQLANPAVHICALTGEGGNHHDKYRN